MSNVIVDGFGHYGTGTTTGAKNSITSVMLGPWAQLDSGFGGITTLPWDGANPDTYLVMGPTFTSNGARRVIPTAGAGPFVFSFYFAVPNLPTSGNGCIIDFRDGSNVGIGYLTLTSTGAIQL